MQTGSQISVIPSSIVAMIHMNTIPGFRAPTFPFFNFNVSLCLPASTRVIGMKNNLLLTSCLICCTQVVGLDDLNGFFQPQCDSRYCGKYLVIYAECEPVLT